MSQQQPLPRKKHTGRNIMLAVVAAGVLLMAAAALAPGNNDDKQPTATGTTTAKATTKTTAKAPATADTETACGRGHDRNAPCKVTAGAAFVIGKHQMLAGWTVKDVYGSFTVAGKVKNVSDSTSTAFMNIKFLKGDEVLGDVACNSSELEPGQTATLNCIPNGEYTKKFDRVTVEATF